MSSLPDVLLSGLAPLNFRSSSGSAETLYTLTNRFLEQTACLHAAGSTIREPTACRRRATPNNAESFF